MPDSSGDENRQNDGKRFEEIMKHREQQPRSGATIIYIRVCRSVCVYAYIHICMYIYVYIYIYIYYIFPGIYIYVEYVYI